MVLRIKDFVVLLMVIFFGSFVTRTVCGEDKRCRIYARIIWMLFFISMLFLVYKLQELSGDMRKRMETRTLFKRD